MPTQQILGIVTMYFETFILIILFKNAKLNTKKKKKKKRNIPSFPKFWVGQKKGKQTSFFFRPCVEPK